MKSPIKRLLKDIGVEVSTEVGGPISITIMWDVTPCSRDRYVKGKGKAVPLQAWSGPEGSRKLRFSYFMTTAQDGDKVVSLTHRPPLPPGNIPGTHFC
jgi:hypothetical protein